MNLPAFPKPGQREGIVTLAPAQRAVKRRYLFDEQCGICACGCGTSMVWEQGRMETCTLEHKVIQPMGHPKNDNDSNLCATRWDHNAAKGSKRI